MELPNNFASSGQVGHFTEPDRDSIYFEGDMFALKAAPHPGELKFSGLNLPPFLRFQRTSNTTFTVFGSWFSLVSETAKRINYSLVGMAPTPDLSEEDFLTEVSSFRPDIALYPLQVQTDAVLNVVEMGMIRPSRIIAPLEVDHILSAKRLKKGNLASMVTPFDFTSLVLTVTAMTCIAFLARYFRPNPVNRVFHDVIWNLTTALIWAPEVTAKKAVWRFVGVTWTLGVFLLQQLFAGAMFESMTLSPDLDVVDTFKDLALRTSGPITVFDSYHADLAKYFSPEKDYRNELTARLRKLPILNWDKESVVEEILVNVSTGNQYFLGSLYSFELYLNDMFNESFRDHVHISKDCGEILPIFLVTNPWAEPIIISTFNDVIVKTQESGIYSQWLASYSKKKKGEKDITSYQTAQLKHFYGLFVICAIMTAFAFIVMILEMFGKKKVKNTQSKHQNINTETRRQTRLRWQNARFNISRSLGAQAKIQEWIDRSVIN